MRTIAAAIVCVVAAFGAAFLLTRAVNHGTTARASAQVVLPALPTETVPAADNRALAAQFAPQRVSLRKPPAKPRVKAHHSAPASISPAAGSSTPAVPQSTVPVAPTYTTPPLVQTTPQTYTPPVAPSAPAQTTTSTTRHRSSSGSGSGSGSGTTVIGG